MFRSLFTNQILAEWGSAALVFVAGAIVGREASLGMSLGQWTGGIAAVVASVVLAVIVRAWPAPVKMAQRRIP